MHGTCSSCRCKRLETPWGAPQAWGLMGWRCGYIAYPNQVKRPCQPLPVGLRSLVSGRSVPCRAKWADALACSPAQDGSDYLGLQLVKVQDTIPIHTAHMSQKVALGALAAGKPWLDARMQALRSNRWGAPAALWVPNTAAVGAGRLLCMAKVGTATQPSTAPPVLGVPQRNGPGCV